MSVLKAHKRRNRQAIAPSGVDRLNDFFYKFVADVFFLRARVIRQICPARVDSDLNQPVRAHIDSLVVHLHDRFALFGVGFVRVLFHVFLCVGKRDDVCKFEKRRLHDGVRAVF